MPMTIETTVYKFEELNDRAKERARDWWRDCENEEGLDTDFLYDDFARMAALLGIEFKTRPVKLMSGKTRSTPCIWWSGFSSQGDGASFEGSYSYAKGAPRAIRKETGGNDKELIRIATELQDIQKRHGYRLTASMSQGANSNFYSHSGTMAVEVDNEHGGEVDVDAYETVRGLMRDFADWMYRQLEHEYEWRMADEQVDDAIAANEYDFTQDGHRA